MIKFSVLMSVYYKEKASYLEKSLLSIENQTITPNEIVLVKDGLLTDELNSVIEKFIKKNPGIVRIIQLNKNIGLGLALAEGIKQCKYELIARMDSDDISVKNRFELQLKEFQADPDLDICGSHIIEFEKNPSEIVSIRKVPLKDSEIKKYQKKRDGFNHVTTMYKKEAVLRAGNYRDALLMEDTLLWVNMILTGSKGKNIDDYLVYVRTDQDMFERRGGLNYFFKYLKGRKMVRETGYISSFDYYYSLLVQLVFALMPVKIRIGFYRKFLRKKIAKNGER